MRIPNPYFQNIPIIGDLIMDYVILEYGYPLLFICRTKNDIYYLCDCCDTYKEQRWLLAPVTIEDIQGLLNNKITIREVFENAVGPCCVVTWSTGDLHEKYKIMKANEFESRDLPEVGEYIDAEDGEYENYIKKLENRIKYKKEFNLQQKVQMKGVKTLDSMEFSDLEYQYKKAEAVQGITNLGSVKGTTDSNITEEISQRKYFGEMDNRQSTADKYRVFAA